MSTQLIIELVIALIGVVPTVVSLVTLVIKMIKDKNWVAVAKFAQDAMSQAEAYAIGHPGMSGKDKLDMALSIVKQTCAANNISLDEVALQKVIAYIEELIKWSKTVNNK